MNRYFDYQIHYLRIMSGDGEMYEADPCILIATHYTRYCIC